MDFRPDNDFAALTNLYILEGSMHGFPTRQLFAALTDLYILDTWISEQTTISPTSPNQLTVNWS